MSSLPWSGDPANTLWENFPPPPEDNNWTRRKDVTAPYGVLKGTDSKHVRNPEQRPGWLIVLGLGNLLTTQAAQTDDNILRPYLDRLSLGLEQQTRAGFLADARIVTYESSRESNIRDQAQLTRLRGNYFRYHPVMDHWRWEPRWEVALSSGLLVILGQPDREIELCSALFREDVLRRPARFRELVRQLLEFYAEYQGLRWVWPTVREVRRVFHPADGSVEWRRYIRPLGQDRWRNLP